MTLDPRTDPRLTTHVPTSIGVLGAGTMGAGIAQLAARIGARTLLYDPVPDALERALAEIDTRLARDVAKNRLSTDERAALRARLAPSPSLHTLAECEMVIEAAPERLDLKRDLLNRLSDVVDERCIVATNTSSLSITELASEVARSERFVGMHFFNPAAVMRLIEVIPGEQTSPATVAVARATGAAMGKHIIEAADVPGFLVNRVNRPFFLEALTILTQRIATVAQIDRIVRMGGGFPMGPFELMDLVGIDTNHAVAAAFSAQSFGEPRYRPSPLAARKIAARMLGRKTGKGWYQYGPDRSSPVDPVPPPAAEGNGLTVIVAGALPIAAELLTSAHTAGFDARPALEYGKRRTPWLVLDCGDGADALPLDAPCARLLHRGSLHELDPASAGFHVLPPLDSCRLVEVTATRRTRPEATARLSEFLAALGRHAEPVGDTPGLVLGRLLSALVNETAFLLGEGNGTASDVDSGMTLGLNHPRGPIAWSQAIGLPHVTSLLSALHRELGEERYRQAPFLRRQSAIDGSLQDDPWHEREVAR